MLFKSIRLLRPEGAEDARVLKEGEPFRPLSELPVRGGLRSRWLRMRYRIQYSRYIRRQECFASILVSSYWTGGRGGRIGAAISWSNAIRRRLGQLHGSKRALRGSATAFVASVSFLIREAPYIGGR